MFVRESGLSGSYINEFLRGCDFKHGARQEHLRVNQLPRGHNDAHYPISYRPLVDIYDSCRMCASKIHILLQMNIFFARGI